MEPRFSQLSEHLYIHYGHVNTGILRDGDRALLIDPSGIDLQTTLVKLDITQIEHVLFTHHHRDNTAGFPIADNVRVGVPEKEAPWFIEVETFWNDPQYRWHLYNYHPHNLMLADAIRVTDTYTDGAQIVWGSAVRESLLKPPGILMAVSRISLMLMTNVSLSPVISSTMKVRCGNSIVYRRDSRRATITGSSVQEMNLRRVSKRSVRHRQLRLFRPTVL